MSKWSLWSPIHLSRNRIRSNRILFNLTRIIIVNSNMNGTVYDPPGQTGFGGFNDWGCVGGDNMWTDEDSFWLLQDQLCNEMTSYSYN
ncbi:BnaC04g52400D [Brassica napus]|uniref:BnaC04g52400D protein n=1 Tax=Brassica napus TaxID=3708 RepID=A0A078J9R6_BRANA|nr:BnaC04g52400D [Brassica napus]